jgi:ATP synthase, F1 epsilon subunit (delta in mitochondria)
MKKFLLEILTPEKTFYKDEVDSLVIETSEGQMGILAGHVPMAIGLQPAVVKIRNGDKVLYAANGEGFVEIRPDETVVLCQTMEWPEEIEINRVKKAIEENERKIREHKSEVEFKMSKASLSRAFARLKALNK